MPRTPRSHTSLLSTPADRGAPLVVTVGRSGSSPLISPVNRDTYFRPRAHFATVHTPPRTWGEFCRIRRWPGIVTTNAPPRTWGGIYLFYNLRPVACAPADLGAVPFNYSRPVACALADLGAVFSCNLSPVACAPADLGAVPFNYLRPVACAPADLGAVLSNNLRPVACAPRGPGDRYFL